MNYFELKKRSLLSGANVFWLPTGVGRDHVLAAYQFKGVSSEAFALQDISGNAKPLVKYSQVYNGITHTPAWNSESGFSFDAVIGGFSGYLDNNALDNLDIKSAVVCYTGLTGTKSGYLMTAGGSGGTAFLYAATTVLTYDTVDEEGYHGGGVMDLTGPGYALSPWLNYGWVGTVVYDSTAKTSGVIGANFGTVGGLYLDGTSAVTSSTPAGHTFTDVGLGGNQGHTFGNSHRANNTLNGAVHAGKTIVAAAFFDVELTADQHLEVATAMLSL